MSTEQHLDFSTLIRDRSLPTIEYTSEKVVFKATLDGELRAIKIFRKFTRNDRNPIDQSAEALAEYSLLMRYQDSSLREFVPSHPQLVTIRGKIVGLSVEWKEGNTLSMLAGKVKLPHTLFDHLRACFLELPPEIWPDSDAFSEANISWDGAHLWLAELVTDAWPSVEAYETSLTKSIEYLKKEFGEKDSESYETLRLQECS